MLIQYLRQPLTEKQWADHGKILEACLSDDTDESLVLQRLPLGTPIGCVIVVPVLRFTSEQESTLKCIGFQIGWSLYNLSKETVHFSKKTARELALRKAELSTVTDPETGKANFPHSLTNLIELMIKRGKVYYKTDNVINYV